MITDRPARRETAPLPLEDGRPSAQLLPLDEQLSGVAFETATFGLG